MFDFDESEDLVHTPPTRLPGIILYDLLVWPHEVEPWIETAPREL